MAHGLAGLFGLNVFTGLANERPQLLRIGVGVAAQPVAQGAIFGNQLSKMPESYVRYLMNGLRQAFDLKGVPIRFSLRGGKNPFDKDR